MTGKESDNKQDNLSSFLLMFELENGKLSLNGRMPAGSTSYTSGPFYFPTPGALFASMVFNRFSLSRMTLSSMSLLLIF